MASRSRQRVAGNFIANHGRDGLRRLLILFQQGVSGQVIADEFGVSRERVRQWRNAFGRVITHYQVHTDVAALLESNR